MKRMTPALAPLAFVVLLGSLAASAEAAFPGRNGRIAFSELIGLEHAQSHLRTIRRSGKGRRLISTQGYDPAFSPRGRRLVYGALYEGGLWLRRADGRGRARRLKGTATGFAQDPDWSPGGRRIVFEVEGPAGSELRIYVRGRTTRLTDGANPAWSVRGEIAFTRMGAIYAIRPDGRGLRLVVERGDHPDWSPSGRRIVFVRDGWIMITTADGGGLRQLRRGTEPAFSPDGRQLAYIDFGVLWTMTVSGRRPHAVEGPDEDALEDPDWQPLPRRRCR